MHGFSSRVLTLRLAGICIAVCQFRGFFLLFRAARGDYRRSIAGRGVGRIRGIRPKAVSGACMVLANIKSARCEYWGFGGGEGGGGSKEGLSG